MLNVVDAESDSKLPQFVKRLQDVEVTDGQEVMLFCVVSGQPMPSITWYHNGKNIAKNEEYVFTYDRLTGHIYLVILDCLSDDEGEFQCVATNVAGQATTQCKLRIVPSDSSKPLSAISQPQPLMINVTSDKRDTVSKTGVVSSASSTASKAAEPEAKSSMVSSTAVNGHLTSTESLTLVPPDILFHTKKIPGQSRKVASYRTVLRRASDNDLLNYRTKSGDDVHRQNVTWKVSDWSVYARGTVQRVESVPTVSQSQSVIRPELKQPPQREAWSAVVTSLPSTQTTSTKPYVPMVSSGSKTPLYGQPLKVSHVKPSQTVAPVTSYQLFEPPRFILALSNQTARDGDVAILRVRFHGNPMPKLHWFFNQKVIEDEEDFLIYTDLLRGESVLRIKEVFPEDDGEFVCKAENDYGSAVTHCRLTVQCKLRNYFFCICIVILKS